VISTVGDIAFAAEDPNNDGWYNQTQLTQDNSFFAYLHDGDKVTFSIAGGYHPHTTAGAGSFEDISRCGPSNLSDAQKDKLRANVSVYSSGGSLEDSSGWTLANDTKNATSAASVGNTTKRLTFNVHGDDGRARFQISYDDCGGDNHKFDIDRGYRWKIEVTDRDGKVQQGRIRVEGRLKVWQQSSSGGTDLMLRYARTDGYRYAVKYPNYQGIYSWFVGSVYGIYSTNDTDTINDDLPYYGSVKENDSTYDYPFDSDDRGKTESVAYDNNAYLFLDCMGTDVGACPGNIGAVANANNGGVGGIDTQPIQDATYDLNVIEGGAATTSTYYDYPARSTGKLTGGTLHIRYNGMQSGVIHLKAVKSDGTVLCGNRQFIVDNQDASGEMTWNFGARDTACGTGTLVGGAQSLDIDEKVTLQMWVSQRGEMHFIAVDTESRAGGIEVTTNFATDKLLSHSDALFGGTFCGVKDDGTIHSWSGAGYGCDAEASVGTSKSTWGNRRAIQDWIWDSHDGATLTYMIGPHYNLTPITTRDSGNTSMRAGTPVTIHNSVHNDSLMARASGWEWKSYAYVVHSGSTAPTISGDGYADADTVCTLHSLDCTYLTGGSGVTAQEDGGTTALPDTTFDTSGLHYGDYVCSYLAVRNYYVYPPFTVDTSTKWRVSSPAGSLQDVCVRITKTPRLQVWGNDVRVGSAFLVSGNQSSSINTNRGSWGEYGVFAGSTITTFGSAASPLSTNLTFANTPSVGHYATVANLGTIPDVKTYLTKAGNGTYAAKTHVDLHQSNDLTLAIGATTLDASSPTSPVYDYPNATATITGDIKNESNGATLRQMVIIAKNILIDPSVKQIDAWLIATDTINTCSTPGNPEELPTVANCGSDQLTVNGPIMATRLLLRRTGGDDANQNSPAETINLRGDAYVWVRGLSEATGTVRTVYTRELAPRY
jgi:hypothetical protein